MADSNKRYRESKLPRLSTSLVARGRAEAARALGTSRTPSRPTRVAALAVIFLLALAVRSLYALDLAPVMYSRVQPGTYTSTGTTSSTPLRTW